MSILEKPVCELAYYQNIIDDLKKKGNVPVAFGCVDPVSYTHLTLPTNSRV